MRPTRRRRRWHTLIGVLIAVAATIAVIVAAINRHPLSGTPSTEATRHPLSVGFIDDTGATQISIQISPHLPDTGQFTLAVPHMGLLFARAQLSPRAGDSVTLTYRGPAELLTTATTTDSTHPLPSQTPPRQPPQQKELILEGIINAAARTARLHMAISSVQDTHTRRLNLIETPANRLTAEQTLDHLLQAVRRHDIASVLAALAPGTVNPGEQKRLTKQLSGAIPSTPQPPTISARSLETLQDGHRIYTATIMSNKSGPKKSFRITLILLDTRWYLA